MSIDKANEQKSCAVSTCVLIVKRTAECTENQGS